MRSLFSLTHFSLSKIPKRLTTLIFNFWLLIFVAFFSGCRRCDSSSEEEAKSKGHAVNFSTQERSSIPFKEIDTISFILNKSETVDFICSARVNDYFCKSDDGQTDCPFCDEKYEYEVHTYLSKNNGRLEYQYNIVHESNFYSTKFYMQYSFMVNNSRISFTKDTSNWPLIYLDSLQIINKTYGKVMILPYAHYDSDGKLWYDTVWYTKEFGVIKMVDRPHNQYELMGLK